MCAQIDAFFSPYVLGLFIPQAANSSGRLPFRRALIRAALSDFLLITLGSRANTLALIRRKVGADPAPFLASRQAVAANAPPLINDWAFADTARSVTMSPNSERRL